MPLHHVIILIAGLPGTGKSYMSRQIQARCPELHDISIDLIKEHIWATRGFLGAEDKTHTENLARQQYFDDLDAAMTTGRPIITDYPFSKKQRPQLIELCTRHNYRPLTLRLTAEFDTLFQRQRQRDLSPERSIAFILDTYHPSLLTTPLVPALSPDGSVCTPAASSDCRPDGSVCTPAGPSDCGPDGSVCTPAAPSDCGPDGSVYTPAAPSDDAQDASSFTSESADDVRREEANVQGVPERFRGVPPIIDTPAVRQHAPDLLTREVFWDRCTTRGYDTFELGPLYELDVTVFDDAATHTAVHWVVETATQLSGLEPALPASHPGSESSDRTIDICDGGEAPARGGHPNTGTTERGME